MTPENQYDQLFIIISISTQYNESSNRIILGKDGLTETELVVLEKSIRVGHKPVFTAKILPIHIHGNPTVMQCDRKESSRRKFKEISPSMIVKFLESLLTDFVKSS